MSGSDLFRRIGRLRVPMEIIRNQPGFVMRLMKDMLVLEARYEHDTDSIYYVVISSFFPKVPEGHIAPYYGSLVDLLEVNKNATSRSSEVNT